MIVSTFRDHDRTLRAKKSAHKGRASACETTSPTSKSLTSDESHVVLDFHCPSKIFMPYIEFMKFCQNQWSLLRVQSSLHGSSMEGLMCSIHGSWESLPSLKVHKIENFFGSDFEICVISLLVILKY